MPPTGILDTCSFLCGLISVTYPLDLTKTRLQIQGEEATHKVAYRGMTRTAYGIGISVNIHI